MQIYWSALVPDSIGTCWSASSPPDVHAVSEPNILQPTNVHAIFLVSWPRQSFCRKQTERMHVLTFFAADKFMHGERLCSEELKFWQWINEKPFSSQFVLLPVRENPKNLRWRRLGFRLTEGVTRSSQSSTCWKCFIERLSRVEWASQKGDSLQGCEAIHDRDSRSVGSWKRKPGCSHLNAFVR